MNRLNSKNFFDDSFEPEISKELFKLTIKLGDKVISRDFDEDVGIDYDNLEQDMVNIPTIFAFWSTILAKQRMNVDYLKQKIAVRKAHIYNETRKAADSEDIKIAKYQIDEIVVADDKIVELNSKLLIEEHRLSALYGLVDALKIKSDLLRSLAGFKRQELERS